MSSLANIRHVVFDWNGTLLDDCDLAVATVNTLLRDANLPPVTRLQYRTLFRFPIIDFYHDLGLTGEGGRFPALMRTYLARFNAAVDECALHVGAQATIAGLNAAGLTVSILSASQRDTLIRSVQAKGLETWLLEAVGLEDGHAHGKIAVAHAFVARHQLDPREVLLIGDTDHDHEVAEVLGWSFLFVEHGHQEGVRIRRHQAKVLSDLSVLLHLLPSRIPSRHGAGFPLSKQTHL